MTTRGAAGSLRWCRMMLILGLTLSLTLGLTLGLAPALDAQEAAPLPAEAQAQAPTEARTQTATEAAPPATEGPASTGAAAAVDPGTGDGTATQAAAPPLPPEAQARAADAAAWAEVARRAEGAISADRASDTAFRQLRQELAGWRDRFSAQMDDNATRVELLRAQLATLGTVDKDGKSADGVTELPAVAARRAALQGQIAEAAAPGLLAAESWRRADGLVSEIDGILRHRKVGALRETMPAPVNPANWPAAVQGLGRALSGIGADLVTSTTSARNHATLVGNLPHIVMLLGLALLALRQGPRLIRRWTLRLARSGRLRARRLAAMIVSLGEVLVPALGTFLIYVALERSALLPVRLDQNSLAVLPLFVVPIFIVRWLGHWTFPGHAQGPLAMDPERQGEARLHMKVLAVIAVLDAVRLAYLGAAPDETQALLTLALQLASAFSLFRLGRLLHSHGSSEGGQEAEEAAARSFRGRLVALTGNVVSGVALASPLLAAGGYAALANALTMATVLTLAVFAVLLILEGVISDVHALATGNESNDEALVPVLATILTGLLMLPFLALIWGAQPTDLAEIWSRARVGFEIGGVAVSPSVFLMLLVVFSAGWMATRLTQGALRSVILPRTKLDKGGRTAMVSGVGYLGIFLAGLFAVMAAGINLSSLAFFAGALTLGVGFGMQNIVQNFVSGIILLIERPVSEGDWIEAGGRQGIVKAISVRSTRIETFDRTEVIVPNADLVSGQVVNWTRGNPIGRVIVPVTVAHGSDTRAVEAVLMGIAEAHPLVMIDPGPRIVFQSFGADGLLFEVRVMIRDINFGISTRSDINHEIARRFAEEGIRIPVAQRDLWLRNPEALAAQVLPDMHPASGANTGATTGPAPL